MKQNLSRGIHFSVIENQKKYREEGIVLLTEQIEREVRKVSQNLTIENKIRDEACKKLTNMIDDSFNKLRTLITVIYQIF